MQFDRIDWVMAIACVLYVGFVWAMLYFGT